MNDWEVHCGPVRLLVEDGLNALLPSRRFQQKFMDALHRMLSDELPRWLAQGADPNASRGAWTALGIASRSPFTDEVLLRELLAAGADVNPSCRYPPLLQAAHDSTDAKIQMLMDAGADATAVDFRYNRSVVSELVSWASSETILYALKRGARVDIGYPFHSAIWFGRSNIIELL